MKRPGPLVWFSVSFPVLHLSLTHPGFATPELVPVRAALTLALLIVIATMVVLYARLMRAENQRLERERVRSQKGVNDSLGHDTGDATLCQLASRLRRSIRENDTVALLSGDEFVVVIEGLRAEDDADRTASFLATSLSAPYDVDGEKVAVASTVGSTYFPSQGATLEDLLKEADTAMYCNKSGELALPSAFSSPN